MTTGWTAVQENADRVAITIQFIDTAGEVEQEGCKKAHQKFYSATDMETRVENVDFPSVAATAKIVSKPGCTASVGDHRCPFSECHAWASASTPFAPARRRS